ncbi:hypothetical protein [Rhizobium sp. BT-175]|nr:hypothetical protein [Rhizobium sp. BT-175]MCV9947569.1 hypothetical protein [Rhizobium sp. BT-175]
MTDQLAHDRLGASIIIAKQHGVAALSLDNRGDIGGSMFLS